MCWRRYTRRRLPWYAPSGLPGTQCTRACAGRHGVIPFGLLRDVFIFHGACASLFCGGVADLYATTLFFTYGKGQPLTEQQFVKALDDKTELFEPILVAMGTCATPARIRATFPLPTVCLRLRLPGTSPACPPRLAATQFQTARCRRCTRGGPQHAVHGLTRWFAPESTGFGWAYISIFLFVTALVLGAFFLFLFFGTYHWVRAWATARLPHSAVPPPVFRGLACPWWAAGPHQCTERAGRVCASAPATTADVWPAPMWRVCGGGFLHQASLSSRTQIHSARSSTACLSGLPGSWGR